MASMNTQRRASQGYDERRPIGPRYGDLGADPMANGLRVGQNGLSRTASQRQRTGDEGPYSSPGMGYPDSGSSNPGRPQYRTSYDPPYPDASPNASRSAKSFAARAAAAPQKPNIARIIKDWSSIGSELHVSALIPNGRSCISVTMSTASTTTDFVTYDHKESGEIDKDLHSN